MRSLRVERGVRCTPNRPEGEPGRGAKRRATWLSECPRGGRVRRPGRGYACDGEGKFLTAGSLVTAWIVFGLISAVVAKARNANALQAFVIGILLGPFGLIFAFGLPSHNVSADPSGLPPGWRRECPYCKSQIQTDASVCRYCNRESDAVPFVPAECQAGRSHKWEESELYPGYIVCSRCETYAKDESQAVAVPIIIAEKGGATPNA
jgi:hypothetical protein